MLSNIKVIVLTEVPELASEAWTNKRSSKQKVFELDQRQSFYNQNTHRDFACTFKYIISCVIGLYTLNV